MGEESEAKTQQVTATGAGAPQPALFFVTIDGAVINPSHIVTILPAEWNLMNGFPVRGAQLTMVAGPRVNVEGAEAVDLARRIVRALASAEYP